MTKKPPIKTSSEQKPEVIDFDKPMDPEMREFANALQGLKSYCVDHGYSFEEATKWYQEWIRLHVLCTPRQGVEATIEHVQHLVAVREAQKGIQEAQIASWMGPTPFGQKVQAFFEEMNAIGFPRDRAFVILSEEERSDSPLDLFESARERVAAEIRKTLGTA